jgi:hypothetical protein
VSPDPTLLAALVATLDAHPAKDGAAAIGQADAIAEVLAIAIARAAVMTGGDRALAGHLARREAGFLPARVAVILGGALEPLAR